LGRSPADRVYAKIPYQTASRRLVGPPTGKRYVFDLSKDVGERSDLTNQRQDVARRLRPLIAAWEADVDAEAKATSTSTQ
jgi:hypothetical protein